MLVELENIKPVTPEDLRVRAQIRKIFEDFGMEAPRSGDPSTIFEEKSPVFDGKELAQELLTKFQARFKEAIRNPNQAQVNNV
ncbi:hypothetical protein ACFL0Y_00055 [Patescibacteria group bacterium]